MSNGNFKVRCIKSRQRYTTEGKIYDVVNGKIVYDDGSLCCGTYYSVEEMNEGFESKFELVKEQLTDSIYIYTKKNRVVATITKGEQKYKQFVKLSDADGDYWKAVHMVIDRLQSRFVPVEAETDAGEKSESLTAEYKVGDRVEHEKYGKGTVIGFYDGGEPNIGVEFDAKLQTGHDLNVGDCPQCKNGHGWFCYKSELKIIDCIPSKPTVTEVHRQAEVGEWIKILKVSENGHEDYNVGDIMQIIHSERNKYISQPYYKDELGAFLDDDEYVVLENYQPEEPKPEPSEPKPFVKAKVGDKIKIVKKAIHTGVINIGEEMVVDLVLKNGVGVTGKGYFQMLMKNT